MAVKFAELESAFEFADFNSGTGPFHAYVCRRSGRIYLHSDDNNDTESLDELPEDIDDEDKYLPVPSRRDLGLSKPLALDFARQHLANDYDLVREFFSRRGAYPKFENLLARRRALDKWHAFKDAATKVALRTWAAENGLELVD